MVMTVKALCQLSFRDINKNHGLPHPPSKSSCLVCTPGGGIQLRSLAVYPATI